MGQVTQRSTRSRVIKLDGLIVPFLLTASGRDGLAGQALYNPTLPMDAAVGNLFVFYFRVYRQKLPSVIGLFSRRFVSVGNQRISCIGISLRV